MLSEDLEPRVSFRIKLKRQFLYFGRVDAGTPPRSIDGCAATFSSLRVMHYTVRNGSRGPRCCDGNRTSTTRLRGAGGVCHQIPVCAWAGGLNWVLVRLAKPIMKCAAISMEGRSYGGQRRL